MIAFNISYQLFHYFQLYYFAGHHVGSCSLRVMYIYKIYCFLYTCLLFVHIYYSMYISGVGAYNYLFTSRVTESQSAECAVRCVHMC